MITKLNPISCDNLTAVVACPSVGNVGQLATDLLISNLKADYVGMAWHPGLLPLAGGDPFNKSSHQICTSNDFYLSNSHGILFVQLRAPVLRKQASSYCSDLIDLFNKLGVKKVVIFSGMFGHQRDDNEMRAGSFRFILNRQAETGNDTLCQTAGWVRLAGNDSENGSLCPKLPGTGFTKILMNLCTERSLPCVGLICFCSEGDNINDSLQFTIKINEWLKLLSSSHKIEMPISWKYLFGNEANKDMY